MESTLFEVRAVTAITWDDVRFGGRDFSMRFVHAGTRRDHRIVRIRGSDVDERLLQEAAYNFCDRVRIQQLEDERLRLEFWREGALIGAHRLESFDVGDTMAE